MALKRLELFGFKTFADRTELEFPDGVTAVVGPNGSGKSNIADAILWVLGESNVRHLRGDRAQDVIFAGTHARKPLGMAEASLTFDNTTGVLPMDEPEITVTRRVYRSGEGEYFINRTPCRLRDIHDLFLDTGIGRDAYNMVGQSEIDAILSARPEDRRQLFEEAAGIKKYRVRKNEALRRLESTSSNLLRVTDILSEVERQVGPLEKAASVAGAFRQLDERRQNLERVILAFDARRLDADVQDLVSQASVIQREVEAARSQRTTAEAAEAAARLELTRLERDLEEARARLEDLRAQGTRREAERTVMLQRREEAMRRESELVETLASLRARMERADQRRSEAAVLAEDLFGRLESLQRRLEQAKKATDAERTRVQAVNMRLSELRTEQARLQTAIATRSSEARSARAETERLSGVCQGLDERITTLNTQQESARKDAAEAAKKLEELGEKRERLEVDLSEAESARQSALRGIQDAEEALAGVRRQSASSASRHRTLAEMAEQHEGFYAGVRATLEAAKAGRLGARYDAVADVLQVPKGLETAIETALGSQLQDIICATDAAAKEAIALLKADNAGRATFLPLDLLNPAPRVTARIDAGVLGWAADLISCDPEYRPAMETLLGRVLVVENLDVAVALIRRERLPIRVVSLDGEIVSGQGSITGGRGKGAQSHLLTRKREMEDLQAELKRLEQETAIREKGLEVARLEREACDQRLREIASAQSEVRLSTAEAVRQKQYAEATVDRLGRETAITTREHDASKDRARQMDEQASTLEMAATRAREQLEPITTEIASLEQSLSSADGNTRDEQTALEVKTAEVRERHTAALAEVDRTRETIETTGQDIFKRAQQRDEARRIIAECAEKEESLEGNVDGLETEIQEAMAALDSHRTARDAALTAAAAEREKAHAAEEKASAASVRAGKMEVRMAQLASERRHLLVRLREIVEGISAPSPHDASDDEEVSEADEPETLEEEAWEQEAVEALLQKVDVPADFSRHSSVIEWNRLKRQIADLGPVNLAAEEEFLRTSERRDFLRTQHDDLVNAEETLRRVIREIDESTKETFQETYHRIEEAFGVMFHRLFGGGSTRLVLTDPDNILDTGIEIIVQPPGKKLQNLVLLSGGERALTAAALLFAFLMVKPSPFCVLDEVDAPLDEANIGRFAALVHEFSQNSQFIVITHNRGTMEAADALYGVSMQEPGISRLVSLKMEDRNTTGSAPTGGIPAAAASAH